ncbi:MAG: IPT/TIG domain-containing protein [Gemmatimonadota bacterium]
MKAGLVRNLGISVLALGVVALGACNDDPTDFGETTPTRLQVNPTTMIIPAGRTGELDVVALNQGGEPTFGAVSATPGCGPATVTVADDPQQTPIQPPGQMIVTAGSTLGTACIVIASGGVTDTVNVVVVADDIVVTSAPSVLRAGQTGTVVVDIVDANGTSVTPFAPTDATWATSNSNVVAVDASGNLTTTQSGSAAITATWSGTAATSTTGLGVTVSTTASVQVDPNVPTSAVWDAAVSGGSFGSLPLGNTLNTEAVVLDALGNQNTFLSEVLGVTVVSDNPGAVMAVASLDTVVNPIDSTDVSAHANVVLTAVGGGVANITATVTTSNGVFVTPTASIGVPAPAITSAPASGPLASTNVITGSGFDLSGVGVATNVTVNGLNVIFTVDSDTQITAIMPTLDQAGTFPLVVDVGGVTASTTWTQTANFNEGEPGNDAFGTEPIVSVPMNVNGTISAAELPQAFGQYDLFTFTLAQTATVNFTITWDAVPEDVDIYIWDHTFLPGPDGTFGTFPNGWACGAAGGSGGGGFQPETTGSCQLAPGTYSAWVYGFLGGTAVANYNLTATVVSLP